MATASPSPGAPGDGRSAAQRFGWGAPLRVDTFDGGLGQWVRYDGPGHAGKGRRSPGAITIVDGVLRIGGDAGGTTGGMRWNFGSLYGRWEGRMRAPISDPSYTALMLLWPDAEDFPTGGEIDFVEMLDHTRQQTSVFVHYGARNQQVSGAVRVDATQWHTWAVEWSPTGITTYVDGAPWWSTTDRSILPPRAMHLCLQLDWFPRGATVRPSEMFVDWVAFYPITGSGPSQPPGSSVEPSSTSPTSTPATSAPPTVAMPTATPTSPAGVTPTATPSAATTPPGQPTSPTTQPPTTTVSPSSTTARPSGEPTHP